MSRLRTAIAERRRLSARLREDRAFQRLPDRAPTVQSAHELRALSARR